MEATQSAVGTKMGVLPRTADPTGGSAWKGGDAVTRGVRK